MKLVFVGNCDPRDFKKSARFYQAIKPGRIVRGKPQGTIGQEWLARLIPPGKGVTTEYLENMGWIGLYREEE